jgi:hypothetical protein
VNVLWLRPSDEEYVQQIRAANAILSDGSFQYTGREDSSSASDFIFSDGESNLYVSMPDLKVSSIRAVDDTLSEAPLTATEEQAAEAARKWFLKLFPGAGDVRTDSRPRSLPSTT